MLINMLSKSLFFFLLMLSAYCQAMIREKELSFIEFLQKYPKEFPEQYASLENAKKIYQSTVLKATEKAGTPKSFSDSRQSSDAVSNGLVLMDTAQQAFGSFHLGRNQLAQKSRYNRYVAYCRYLVETNKQLNDSYNSNNAKMKQELNAVWNLLHQCKNGANISAKLEAIFRLSQRKIGLSSYVFNDAFQEALAKLYTLCFNSDGSVNIEKLDQSTQEIEKIINDFHQELKKELNEHINELAVRVVERYQNKVGQDRVLQTQLRNNAEQEKFAIDPFNQLLFKLVMHDCQGNTELEQGVRNGILYLMFARNDTPHVQAFKLLASTVENALTTEGSDTTILECHNLGNIGLDGQPLLDGAGIEFTAQCAITLQTETLTAQERSDIQAALRSFDSLCKAVKEGSSSISDEAWNGLKPLLKIPSLIDPFLAKLGGDKLSVLASRATSSALYLKEAYRIKKAIEAGQGKEFTEHIAKLIREQPEKWRNFLVTWQSEIAQRPTSDIFGSIEKYAKIGFLEIGAELLQWESSFIKDPLGTIEQCLEDIVKNLLTLNVIDVILPSSTLAKSLLKKWISFSNITQLLNVEFADLPAEETVKRIIDIGLSLTAQKYVTQAAVAVAKSGIIGEKDYSFNLKRSTKRGKVFDTTFVQGPITKIPEINTILAPVAEAQIAIDAIIASGGDKAIWGKISPTQPFWNNTLIPRSFIASLGKKKVWISGNVTEHFEEFLRKKTSESSLNQTVDRGKAGAVWHAKQTRLANEVILGEFLKDVEELVNQLDIVPGVKYTTPSGDWVVAFSEPKIPGGYTTIHHVEHYTFDNFSGRRKPEITL